MDSRAVYVRSAHCANSSIAAPSLSSLRSEEMDLLRSFEALSALAARESASRI